MSLGHRRLHPYVVIPRQTGALARNFDDGQEEPMNMDASVVAAAVPDPIQQTAPDGPISAASQLDNWLWKRAGCNSKFGIKGTPWN